MVLGADTLLDLLSKDTGSVNLKFSTENFEGSSKLTWVCNGVPDMEEVGGAVYNIKEFDGLEQDFNLWLCDVTSFVFGELPKEIYFAVV